jgi:hypothetical protein
LLLLKMKLVLSFLLLALAAITQAASATGDRLLSIWEDVEDQKLYSKFIGDLESMQNLNLTVKSLQWLTRFLCRARLQDHTCDPQTGGPEAGPPGREDL